MRRDETGEYKIGRGHLSGIRRNGASAPPIAMAKRLGLRYVAADGLSIRRRRAGKGWSYIGTNGHPIADPKVVRRLTRLAVPPAYRDVLYATDPAAHLQAIGRDAAGRLQYRYHPRWEDVRESRKARRLARLAQALPQVRRSLGQYLAGSELTREFACAAVIELVSCSAIRAGTEDYNRLHGTRGAATLLKSNVSMYGRDITLRFRSKGGKIVTKEFAAPRLVKAIQLLRQLPGRRFISVLHGEHHSAKRDRARGQRLSARDRRRENLLEGFSDANGIGERPRSSRTYQTRSKRARATQAGA